jgi:hypothetical protein
MIKWIMKRKYPLRTPVYVRYNRERFNGTVAGWDGLHVLVRTSADKVMLFTGSSVTVVADKEVDENAKV